jgi:perosamine synthetase
MDELCDLSEHRGLHLIEDACEAIGAEYRGRRVGTFGHSAVFSFYPNKQMTTGEGAVITTNDAAAASLLRSLRNQGRDESGAWLSHERLGYNYRMTEMSAALGLAQLERIDAILARREAVAGMYREALAAVPAVHMITPAPWTSRLSWFAAIVRLAPELDRDELIMRLAEKGIPARAYFAPIHLQPMYRRLYGHAPGDFPVAERIARSTLALPFHNHMSAEDVDAVCNTLAQLL